MKKQLFIPFCLSLLCSPLACSLQTTNQNILEKLTPETIQAVTLEIEKLSPTEKYELQEHFLKNFQDSNRAHLTLT